MGRVHSACFNAWDAAQEAMEMALAMALALPDPREDVELLEEETPAPAAAA